MIPNTNLTLQKLVKNPAHFEWHEACLPKLTFYHLAQRGDVPGRKIGCHWRFHKAAIDKWFGQEAKKNRRK